MHKIQNQLKKDISGRAFWMLVIFTVLIKAAASQFQLVYTWIDGAPIDDELMFRAAQSITAGQWLGEYDWLTLSKHMLFPVWAALCHALHIPYLAAGQILACCAALACTMAFAPALKQYKTRLAVYLLLCFNPAVSAEFTLRFYRDNIFPALCMLFFAGLCGYALRCRAPWKKGLPWLCLSGVGLATAWLTREDGMWLMPFALTGALILMITALREKQSVLQKVLRCSVSFLPMCILAAGILAFSIVNYVHYGLFAVSDFSSGGFAEAMGAMSRVKPDEWKPLVSVPADVREKLYDQVPLLAPLEKWLEEDEDLQNSFRNPKLNDYQAGSFYWAIRKAAWYEGVYDSAPEAEAYWRQTADEINRLCDSGILPSEGGKRVGTTPPIRPEYILPVIGEGLKSFGFSLTFMGCPPYDALHMSIGLPEDLAQWEDYLGNGTNSSAQAGTSLPYYNPLQKLVYMALQGIRYLYAVGLPVLFCFAIVIQTRRAFLLLKKRREKAVIPGTAMLWVLLAGLLGMALLRCFMIAFMEVASFNIGTYAMYLSTVHPLLILFSAAGIFTALPECQVKKE